MKQSQALKLLNEHKNNLLKKYPNLAEWLQKHNGYIAGGYWADALLGRYPKDIDVYFSSVEGAEDFGKELMPRLIPLDDKSNLHIKNFELMRFITYLSAMDCINDFDFSCCQIAWDGVTFYFGEHTLNDINTKYLRLLDLHSPLVPTLNRISKYIEKGFKPDEHTFGAICKWIKQNGGADNVPMKYEAYTEEPVKAIAPIPGPPHIAEQIRQRLAEEPRPFGWIAF